MVLAIKAEQMPAWEYAAALAGVTVAQLAQQRLDSQGELYAADMKAADRARYAPLFAGVLELTPDRRTILETKAHELLAEQGLSVPNGEA